MTLFGGSSEGNFFTIMSNLVDLFTPQFGGTLLFKLVNFSYARKFTLENIFHGYM